MVHRLVLWSVQEPGGSWGKLFRKFVMVNRKCDNGQGSYWVDLCVHDDSGYFFEAAPPYGGEVSTCHGLGKDHNL